VIAGMIHAGAVGQAGSIWLSYGADVIGDLRQAGLASRRLIAFEKIPREVGARSGLGQTAGGSLGLIEADRDRFIPARPLAPSLLVGPSS